MIIYHDILGRLSRAGYSAYRLKRERLMPTSCVDRLRTGRPVTTDTLDTVCRLCECQPGDLLSWEPDKKDE